MAPEKEPEEPEEPEEPQKAKGGAGGNYKAALSAPVKPLEFLSYQAILYTLIESYDKPVTIAGDAVPFHLVVYAAYLKGLIFQVLDSHFRCDRDMITYKKFGQISNNLLWSAISSATGIELDGTQKLSILIKSMSKFMMEQLESIYTSIAWTLSRTHQVDCRHKDGDKHCRNKMCRFNHFGTNQEVYQKTALVCRENVTDDRDSFNAFKSVFGAHMCRNDENMSRIFNVITLLLTKMVGNERAHKKIDLDFTGIDPDTLHMSEYQINGNFQKLCFDHAVFNGTPSNYGDYESEV